MLAPQRLVEPPEGFNGTLRFRSHCSSQGQYWVCEIVDEAIASIPGGSAPEFSALLLYRNGGSS